MTKTRMTTKSNSKRPARNAYGCLFCAAWYSRSAEPSTACPGSGGGEVKTRDTSIPPIKLLMIDPGVAKRPGIDHHPSKQLQSACFSPTERRVFSGDTHSSFGDRRQKRMIEITRSYWTMEPPCL